MVDVTKLVEQPRPSEVSLAPSGRPMAVEISALNSQPLGGLIVQEMSPEDVIFAVLPKYRQMTGVRGPVLFKVRQLNEEELALLSRAQAGQPAP